jgi:hypothetical protein
MAKFKYGNTGRGGTIVLNGKDGSQIAPIHATGSPTAFTRERTLF